MWKQAYRGSNNKTRQPQASTGENQQRAVMKYICRRKAGKSQASQTHLMKVEVLG